MLPLIRTARLTLRRWTQQDAVTLQALFDQEDVRRYLFDGTPVSLDRTTALLAMHFSLEQSHGLGYWAAIHDGSVIGFAGASMSPDEETAVELLYGFLPEHWGRGYATEAATAVIEHARQAGFRTVIASTDPPNIRSVRVMERLGMNFSGVLPGPAGQPLVTYRLDI
jgi:[ribosomal protein S5]-alanine N-acetyltransferase